MGDVLADFFKTSLLRSVVRPEKKDKVIQLGFNGTPQEYRTAKAHVIGGSATDEEIAAVRRMAKQAGQSSYKEALAEAGLDD